MDRPDPTQPQNKLAIFYPWLLIVHIALLLAVIGFFFAKGIITIPVWLFVLLIILMVGGDLYLVWALSVLRVGRKSPMLLITHFVTFLIFGPAAVDTFEMKIGRSYLIIFLIILLSVGLYLSWYFLIR